MSSFRVSLNRRRLIGWSAAALIAGQAGQATATRVIRGFSSRREAEEAEDATGHRLIRIPPEGAPEPEPVPLVYSEPAATLQDRLIGHGERTLRLHNANTNEDILATYWRDGYDDVNEHVRLMTFFRDWRQNQQMPLDPSTLDILFALQQASGSGEPITILSAYRTPATNQLLARSGYHVARNSLHLEARALDFHIPGMRLGGVRDTAIALASGGVGYYPNNNFIHVDNGQVRTWIG